MKLLKWFISKATLFMYKRERQYLLRQLHRVRVELENVKQSERPPRIFYLMLVSGEDHRFYSHCGVDLIAVCRAMWRTIACGRREGASTIEMQLVRVLTGQYQKSISRKCREAFLAVLLSMIVPKTEIALLYLIVAYYGTGMQGFSRATHKLHIRPAAMSIRQAASLAARLKYPEPKSMSDHRRNQISFRTEYLISRYVEYFHEREIKGSLCEESHATV